MANERDRGWVNERHGDRGSRHDGYGNEEGGFGYPGVEPGPGGLSRSAAPRGPHAGKGPKNYRRSDERIREDAGDALERHPDIDASDIELHVTDGVVVLSGTVEDRRAKRLAEDVVDAIPGVKDVDNGLRISHGRLDEVLEDFSATGNTVGQGTTGAAGSVPARDGERRTQRPRRGTNRT